jgi:hypothetical protein
MASRNGEFPGLRNIDQEDPSQHRQGQNFPFPGFFPHNQTDLKAMYSPWKNRASHLFVLFQVIDSSMGFEAILLP